MPVYDDCSHNMISSSSSSSSRSTRDHTTKSSYTAGAITRAKRISRFHARLGVRVGAIVVVLIVIIILVVV